MSDLVTLHANRLFIAACRFARLLHELAGSAAFANDPFRIEQIRNTAVRLPVKVAEAHEAGLGQVIRLHLEAAEASTAELTHYLALAKRSGRLSLDRIAEAHDALEELRSAFRLKQAGLGREADSA